MKKFFLYFIPHEKNNHRAIVLQPGFLFLFTAVYLLNQLFLHSLTILKPGVLGYSSEITAEKVLILTNLERQKNQLPPLHYNSSLSKSATAKAQDMFRSNYWAHFSPGGTSPWDFFKKFDYQYSVAGENLAKDFYDTDSVMKAWMNSPTHRANIVNYKYKEIGIGVVNGVLGGVKTTLVVQHFGTPLNGVVADQTDEDLQMNQLASVPSEASRVLATSQVSSTAVSPLQISQIVGGIMFIFIIGVLFIDGYVAFHKKTQRLTGSSIGHIGFLFFIFMIVLVSRSGVIF